MTTYIRVYNPWFLEQDLNGRPAAGYKVYTIVAGTVATLADTYSDKELTSLNTNPVILNTKGEAHIFVNTSIKLVYTAPDGDLSSPIWTEDYASEQQNVQIDNAAATRDTFNNYAAVTVPPYLSIPDRFSLVVTPNADSLGTFRSNSFTGTGINDLAWEGFYTGTTPGSIFDVEVDSCCMAAPDAPTAVLSATAGVVTAGLHSVRISFTTVEGETPPGPVSAVVNADGTHKIDVSAIPVGPDGTLSRKIYMNKAGGAVWYLVATIANNTATTYAINTADAALTVTAPTANTTGDGNGADTFKWRKDGGTWTTKVSMTETEQILIEGVSIRFAQKRWHSLADVWTLTVMTPATLNFCSLGADIIYKNVAGSLVALEDGDMKAGIPAHLDRSSGQYCWVLLNPSLPEFDALAVHRLRRELYENYTVTEADAGGELSCNADITITFPKLSTIPSQFFYINPKTYTVTVRTDPATVADKIYPPFTVSGVTSWILSNAGYGTCQFGNNGASLHVLTAVTPPTGSQEFTTAGVHTWNCPYGVVKAYGTVVDGGGGGGMAAAPGAGGGGGGGVRMRVPFTPVPGTAYAITVAAGGAGATIIGAGADGGVSSIAALVVGDGGGGGGQAAGGGGTAGNQAASAGHDGTAGVDGKGGECYPAGVFGNYGKGGDAGSPATDGQDGYVRIEW